MPTGQGLWPAVWMLGENIDTVSWPACGEIDFMETIGSDITHNHGSLHMPASYGPTGEYRAPRRRIVRRRVPHLRGRVGAGDVRFYVDDTLYETQNQSSVPARRTWEFDHPFFFSSTSPSAVVARVARTRRRFSRRR